jgi:hypothetical protein
MSKPRINLHSVAAAYENQYERIIEFHDRDLRKGGLISIRPGSSGQLVVEVYRGDPGVVVLHGPQDRACVCSQPATGG